MTNEELMRFKAFYDAYQVLEGGLRPKTPVLPMLRNCCLVIPDFLQSWVRQ
jgi:hypothetical protein